MASVASAMDPNVTKQNAAAGGLCTNCTRSTAHPRLVNKLSMWTAVTRGCKFPTYKRGVVVVVVVVVVVIAAAAAAVALAAVVLAAVSDLF